VLNIKLLNYDMLSTDSCHGLSEIFKEKWEKIAQNLTAQCL